MKGGATQITIAIPFYRGAGYLRRALASIQAQSLETWQVVVVDDAGPEPGVGAMIDALGDPRIRCIRNDRNLGLAGNWNRCLGIATTELVTLMHADDELEPEYAEKVVDAHARHPSATAVYTRTSIIDAAGRRTASLVDTVKSFVEPHTRGDALIAGEAGLDRMMRGSFIFCPTLCYRRSAMGGIRFEDRWSFVVDLQLIADLLLGGHEIVGLRERLYRYRRHGASETARLTAGTERFAEELTIYDEIADRAARSGWCRAALTARRKRAIRGHLLVRVAADVARGRPSAARAKLALLRGAS